MTVWSPQHYRKIGQAKGVDPNILERAIEIGERIIANDHRIQPVFTLRHLSSLADVDYDMLRTGVSRSNADPYRIFRIRKRPAAGLSAGFRVICVPEPWLSKVQRWIVDHILAFAQPHNASVAYAKGSDIKDAALLHCGCRWLIKLDIRNFFESVSEIDVYSVFRELNFEPLISFEMARLCTRLGSMTLSKRRARWQARTKTKFGTFDVYQLERIGHLPQGAPTSPMLSNLVCRRLDQEIASTALSKGLIYSRYADDICLSTSDVNFNRAAAGKVIGEVFKVMARHGFSPNITKTHVVPPGGRKVVLGLLVDGPEPRLSKEFRGNLRRHIYYLKHPSIGPAMHATSRGFAAVEGMRNHIFGLINFAHHIDSDFADFCLAQIKDVDWPM